MTRISEIKTSNSALYTKEAKMLIRVVIENSKVEQGYKEIMDITDKIMDFLVGKNFVDENYRVKVEKTLVATICEEATAGDYWGYDINVNIDIPTEQRLQTIEL